LIKNFILEKIHSPFSHIEHKVKKNETIVSILKKNKIKEREVSKVISLYKKYGKNSKILSGSIIDIVIKKNVSKKIASLEKISIPISKSINIEISKDEENRLVGQKIITKLFKELVLAENNIQKSLYASAIEANIKPNIIIEFARIFGFEIDFQRDIRKNDRFQILYERFNDENGEFIKNGFILFAYMSINEKEIELYKFGNDENYGYFDIEGRSVEKALMKTPINGARLSSSFGMRKHPILGFNKMHRGTDFAARLGTPIMSSGTGHVMKAAWCGGGGNCIKIKHNSTYVTIYAHMKSFAKGMRVGKKVRQGEIIGYVGSTGTSTGPHLHYEVLINGKRVNSQKLKLPSGKTLKKKERELFELHRIKTDVLIAELLAKTN
jgi:murein DD-endopeptidase MepM/ murein hydrolase activator NlpD